MKRSSGIIVTGLSAVLLSAGAAAGAGIFSGDGSTAMATAQASALDTAAATDTATAAATPDATASAESTAEATAASGVTGTFDGQAVQTRYGAYQAEITVESGVMTAITWLQEGESDRKSQEIIAYSVPQLESAILAAQSTDVGYISGASYTSDGVEAAVLSAMQVAGIA